MKEIVNQIQIIREQRKKLENQENTLVSSLFFVDCDINVIHSKFLELKGIERMECIEQKKLFVFVCISLCCPTFIIGDRLKSGVRCKLSKVTGLHCSRISHIANEVRFLHTQYKCFRIEADYLYNSIKSSLTS